MMDAETCYRALCARDERFDGLFFVAVQTTGIYCRPVCRARTPARDRCVFYRYAAEADRDGFRACFRCRPELSPGGAPQDSVPRLVRAALARIEGGFLDEGSVDDLGRVLGVTGRHLRRAMEAELGVAPVELAQSRRLALAKQLLQDSSLPLTEIAFASGFGSVRRFNALFSARFGRPPSALRRALGEAEAGAAITLRLDYRPPLDWDALLTFLADRAIAGVEAVQGGVYARSVRLGERIGWVRVMPAPQKNALRVEVAPELAGALGLLLGRLRALFDLDAHPQLIAEALSRDPLLAPLVARHPGLRVPGAFDGFEAAVRAILGQQVSVRAATTLGGRIAKRFGTALDTPIAGVTHLFPPASVLAEAPLSDIIQIGLPASRAGSIQALARAVTQGDVRLERGEDPEAAAAALVALPGIGAWTAQYLGMRVYRFPDAFPASDLGVRKALRVKSTREAEERAAAFRPWRAYAVIHLWQGLSEGAFKE
ncbi:DNA-3-methyladenine glycosylase 2 [Polyangium jinanense]|uniref:DNA-3-methyladenine glycosylase II n=1 Tax=Polyangium jinanense TaxID=2829994 RepID=A0A9X4AY09_9BACT|nr:DNA-3-methyladenine glycosylase 2 [Polyangium jinanense]MDC3962628.1 DNA-3-methyladenine glycosylase 2 family protein [Polyangium jinanense]MDC3988356.1 DNA-3-methyladenine glycosylase 2 family protein [Polyangium jinanense]